MRIVQYLNNTIESNIKVILNKNTCYSVKVFKTETNKMLVVHTLWTKPDPISKIKSLNVLI